MEGRLSKTSSGFLSYDIKDAEQDHIFVLADSLTREFGFQMTGVPAPGPDGVYWDAVKGSVRLTVGWDIWSGAFVMANCQSGNAEVEKLVQWGDFDPAK